MLIIIFIYYSYCWFVCMILDNDFGMINNKLLDFCNRRGLWLMSLQLILAKDLFLCSSVVNIKEPIIMIMNSLTAKNLLVCHH